MDELTQDGFLNGRLQIWQPNKGYRAGVDAVLLAAAVPGRAGERVLELGTGVGTASLCLGARVPGVVLTGVEVQASYADLARRNSDENGVPMDVVTADLAALPTQVREQGFDHVMMNPPYFLGGSQSGNAGRARAMAEDTQLEVWMDVGIRRLAPKGRLTMIQSIARLPEVLHCLAGRLGAVTVLPIQGREGGDPTRFLLTARKSARRAFRLSPAITLHEGRAHEGDRESYRPEIRAILRDGAALRLD